MLSPEIWQVNEVAHQLHPLYHLPQIWDSCKNYPLSKKHESLLVCAESKLGR